MDNVFIKKVELDDKLLILEFVDDTGKYNSIYFKKEASSDLKNKIKEYKKKGTLTFVGIEGNSAIAQVYHPKFIRISKMLEMYVKGEEEKNEQ